MSLIENWREVLRKAWSVRLIILAGLLSGVEVALQIAQPLIDPVVPKGTFSALAGLATAGALVARILAQSSLPPSA